MFDVSPQPLEIKPLNPDRATSARESVDAMFMKIKQAQLANDPIAMAATILVWAELTKDLRERVTALEAAA